MMLNILGAALLVGSVSALGQYHYISFSDPSPGLQLFGQSTTPGQILVSDDEYWGVVRAAGDLAVDFGRVTGINFSLTNGHQAGDNNDPAVYSFNPVDILNNSFFSTTAPRNFTGPSYDNYNPDSTVIIVGTLGKSPMIDSLVASDKLNVTAIEGQWESFVSSVINDPIEGISQALVIGGSDARGTIYGIYDVSEQIGVSPWYFWTDAPIKKQTELWAEMGTKIQKSPSVKYRGLFLNDEQPALSSWIGINFPDATNGAAGYTHKFYSMIFELLLRLRANYLWPALWGSMFYTDDAFNQPLADAYEIVLGSSHTEPMMRAQNEFKKYYQGDWAYNLNNKTIDEYFVYGTERAKPYTRNSLYTMAMRGTGDTEIEGGLGVEGIVKMLEQLVNNQRDIITKVLNVSSPADVPQMWCLYKEVQTYQEKGLHVPEDITLLWADDNWGNVRRLPLKNETARSGGAGVYYHFDYVGDPRDYKWINAVQLQRTTEQLWLAYQRQADRIWIVNVGDLKGLELPLNHYFDLAYDVDQWGLLNNGTARWITAWATREFGSEVASKVLSIVDRFGMYAARRKFELIEPQTYSLINYGEADAVLEQWAELASDAQAVYMALDVETKDSFFQTLLHPILAGEILHKIQIAGARNQLYAGQKRNQANDVIVESLKLLQKDSELTDRWDSLKNGKWAHFMDQTHLGYDGYWQQPMRNTLPAMTFVQTTRPSLGGQLGISIEGSNASIPGDDRFHSLSSNTLTLPALSRYGPRTRWFEVFFRGTEKCAWNASAQVPWLTVTPSVGEVGSEVQENRVKVGIDWEHVPENATAGSYKISFTTCRGLEKYAVSQPSLLVPVTFDEVPESFTEGFVESDGHVSIEAPHYQALVPGSDASITYTTLSSYGRVLGGVGLANYSLDKLSVSEAPALEYRLFLFSNGTANVTLHISPTQNYLGDGQPLEYAISLLPKNQTATDTDIVSVRPVGKFEGAGMPNGWGYAVGDNVWGVNSGNQTTTGFKVDGEGEYVLRIWGLMPSLVVQKVVVDLGGVRGSYLGPPESFLVGRDVVGKREMGTFRDVEGVW